MFESYLQTVHTWSTRVNKVMFVPNHPVVGFLRKKFGGNIKSVKHKEDTHGHVSLSSQLNLVSRITSTVACDMDLTKYPMDEQECMLDLESCESGITELHTLSC